MRIVFFLLAIACLILPLSANDEKLALLYWENNFKGYGKPSYYFFEAQSYHYYVISEPRLSFGTCWKTKVYVNISNKGEVNEISRYTSLAKPKNTRCDDDLAYFDFYGQVPLEYLSEIIHKMSDFEHKKLPIFLKQTPLSVRDKFRLEDYYRYLDVVDFNGDSIYSYRYNICLKQNIDKCKSRKLMVIFIKMNNGEYTFHPMLQEE